jgi:hypothetical protein
LLAELESVLVHVKQLGHVAEALLARLGRGGWLADLFVLRGRLNKGLGVEARVLHAEEVHEEDGLEGGGQRRLGS